MHWYIIIILHYNPSEGDILTLPQYYNNVEMSASGGKCKDKSFYLRYLTEPVLRIIAIALTVMQILKHNIRDDKSHNLSLPAHKNRNMQTYIYILIFSMESRVAVLFCISGKRALLIYTVK